MKLKHGTVIKAKPKGQVTLPAPRDLGATGPANRQGMVIEQVPDSPNKERRARRVDMLESYRNRGTIDQRQYLAGQVLREAWLRTEMSGAGDPTQPKVDKTPDPGRAVAIATDHLSRYMSISKRIPKQDAGILHAVACLGRSVSWLPQYQRERTPDGHKHLSDALSRLAQALRF